MNDISRQTVFDRPAKIYIQNNTDKDFELFKTQLQSGVLTSKPPQIIKSGQRGYFKGDQSGLVGSSGFVTYKIQYSTYVGYITFYWSHPEGATASIYYGYSSPFGLYYIIPKNNLDKDQRPTNQNAEIKDWITNNYSYESVLTLNPTGHDQEVTYMVQYSLGYSVS